MVIMMTNCVKDKPVFQSGCENL